MFFIGVFGISSKQKKLSETGSVICYSCGALSRANLVLSYSYFHIFFIPVFRWNKRYLLTMRCCGAVYEADKDYARVLQDTEKIDFSRLKKVSDGFSGFHSFYAKCQNCGKNIDCGFSWCPHCGAKQKD